MKLILNIAIYKSIGKKNLVSKKIKLSKNLDLKKFLSDHQFQKINNNHPRDIKENVIKDLIGLMFGKKLFFKFL